VNVTGTVPYPWPWDRGLAGPRLALVIAGADAGWVARSHDVEATMARIDELAVVVHVRHDVDAPHDRASSPTRLTPTPTPTPTIEPDATDVLVTARGIDGFYASDLDHVLRTHGRDQLALCGFGLEAPVHSTLRRANDQGYECLLLTDACAPLDPTLTDASLSIVTKSGGIFGALGTATALAAALNPTSAGARQLLTPSEARS
jgi:nicotinamidase-related amidase